MIYVLSRWAVFISVMSVFVGCATSAPWKKEYATRSDYSQDQVESVRIEPQSAFDPRNDRMQVQFKSKPRTWYPAEPLVQNWGIDEGKINLLASDAEKNRTRLKIISAVAATLFAGSYVGYLATHNKAFLWGGGAVMLGSASFAFGEGFRYADTMDQLKTLFRGQQQ